MMARTCLAKPKALPLWEGRGRRGYLNRAAMGGVGRRRESEAGPRAAAAESAERSLWVPHPRNGIYYPKGHEWVMEDVPDGAATFQQAYWLRNQEWVERPGCSSPRARPAMDASDHNFSSI